MLFNKKVFDATQEFMFLGESVNVARYDKQRYPVFEKLIEKQLSFFWRPEEIDVSNDRYDFNNKLEPHEQHIFTSNLKYQTLLDSVQGRAPSLCLLPIASIPELETWIETWSFSECLAEGTEVLTQDGWKDLSETTVEDQCLVYELQSETVFFEKPKQVVEYDMDTDLVHYKASNGKQFEQLVTPNHRMPIIHREVKHDGTQTKYFKDAIMQDYQPHHLAPISGKLRSNNKCKLTAVEKLLIAVQADGTVSDRYTGERCGSIPVWFNLTKQRKIDELTSIVGECGFEMVYLTSDFRDNSQRFKVNIPLSLVEGLNLKTFEWVSLLDISYEWATAFMVELSKWDSHIQNDTSFTYSTISKVNADIVQSIAVMCDKSPRMVVREDHRKETYSDVYSINIIDQNYKDGQSIKKEYVKYKGKVRCLETSTGAFVIRYNGVASVTGNTIHSRSYTHMLRNLVSDPSEFFDSIVTDEEIVKRAESVCKYGDDLLAATTEYNLNKSNPHTLRRLKKSLYLYLVSVNILEGIRFYVSFACSFAFAERKLMEGNAKIIKMVSKDEALHLTGTQHMINILQSGRDDPDFYDIALECRQEVIEMYEDAVDQEKAWSTHLFKDGSMIGLNEGIVNSYVEFITNQRMMAIGLPASYEMKSNPLPWMNSWLSSESVQVAPQEAEISSYLVGQTNNTVAENAFDDFSDF